MPSANILKEKQAMVADLAEKMKNAVSGVLVDYKGITVEEDTKLRRDLREAGVHYAVVKNTLLRLAAQEAGLTGLDEVLNGTTAMALSDEDPVAPAKHLNDFAKDGDKIKIKAGFLEGKVIPLDEVKTLANLPSKEVLIAQVLYGFNYPLTQLAIAFDAIAKKTEDQEALVGTLVAAAPAEEAAPAAEEAPAAPAEEAAPEAPAAE